MASEFTRGDGPASVAENETVQSSIASTANKENKKKKMIDSSHGLRFELKLLALFCVRGLGAGYKFELSKEKEEEGGKLEDLIFRYQVSDETLAGKHWRYRYLQAKHKVNEKEKIPADHLLDYNPKGDFSLPKYFHSFYKIRTRGDDLHDCIICTNIGFDVNSLEKGGVQLVSINDQQEDILEFGAQEKTARYKLKINKEDWHRRLKEEWSPVQLLAEELKDCATKNKTTDLRTGMFNSYHVALVDEHVIDCTAKKFHLDFVGEVNLSEGARELRQTICELGINDSWKDWKFKLSNNFGKCQSAVKNSLPRKITEEDVKEFFDKLVFVVNMPNEKKFEEILETRDMSKYYQPDKCKAQTIRILHEVSAQFSNQEQNFWLKAEIAKNILLDGVAKISLEYQSQLEKEIKFNDSAIQMMTAQLKQLLESDGRGKIERIATSSPKHTAVKVISAVHILMRELNQEGNYLVASSSRLQNEEEMEKWKNILKLQKSFHHFFVVVCDDEASKQHYENFISDDGADEKNIIIIIGLGKSSARMDDEIKYTDLSPDFQEAILSKTICFQGENLTVGNLIGPKPEEIIDFSSIKELLFEEKEIKIPSLNASTFEQSLYVKRTLRFPFKNQFELGGECRINSDGHIEWLVEKEKRKEIWKKIMNGVTNQASSAGVTVDDLAHLKENGNEKSVVIISGLAGTGKSTLLCHYYEEIKKSNPDHWVIKMNLVDYEAILKKDNIARSANIFVYQLHVVDEKSSFSRSLLRNRLERGDRIIFMFDGFDEINELCQKGAIQLMEAISKKKSIQLYVTTRPHMLEDLQFWLSQLAYSLENFTEKDQIDYLTSNWAKELNLSKDNNGPLQQFAKSLVERVSETLRDEEKSFVGIPLQCRILAECFQSNVKELITQNFVEDKEEPRQSECVRNKISDFIEGQKFDLVSLFNRLMETKRKVFCEEKANATNTNQIILDAINRLIQDIEDHLTKLAIKTIVTDQKVLDILLPPQPSPNRSDDDVANGENTVALNGLKFGLTFKSGDESTVQFLHRTYAEYLFARYLYDGFLLDEKRHNKLLDNESIQKLILNKILAVKQYNGVQVFFDSMLKELVDNDEEWRNRIDSRDLPERLKKFTKNLFTQFLRQSPPLHKLGKGFTIKSYFVNALYFSLASGNGTIFKFLCDCLDATFDNHQVQWAMKSSFTQYYCYFSFTFFRNKESKLVKRFIDYFDSNEAASFIVSKSSYFALLPPCGLDYSQWNGEEQQKTVHHLLQFMTNQYEAFDHYFGTNREIDIVPMLTFFIFNENYDSHLKIFLELLSRTTAYSDDSKFANLLKKAFCSKEHFVGGRIEKVLIILSDLKRQNLLTQLYGIVLAIEPKAFQNIYQPPLLLNEKDAISADIKKLLEPDSYRMTGLHRAAFHGDTEVAEKILEKIREDPENETKVMTRDDYGFTPFYVAAVSDQEKIYNNMLAFLKQNLSVDELKEHLMDTKGFIHNALSDANESENVQMVKLILNAIKRELGQNYLINLLKTNITKGSNISPSSLIVKCKTKELFNAIAKIIVERDDIVMDYTALYHFVFHDNSVRNTLKFIDEENLQGLLSLKGVEDFTKHVLDSDCSVNFAFRLMSHHLLQHFNEDQIKQFVQTITLKNNKKKIRSCSTITTGHVADPEQAESIALKFFPECTKDDLVFDDQGNGTTNIYAERLVPKRSYWTDLIGSALTAHYDDRGFVSREDVHCIFDCLKRVGDNSAKQLLLHKEDNGFIMIPSSQQIVQLMLAHLSQESQEEVKRQWKNSASPMNTFIDSNSEGNNLKFGRYYSDILQFYLNYGSDVHLNDFVNLVMTLHQIGEEQFTVWSCIFKNCDKEASEILKLVSEKVEILGRDAVKQLLLHEIDNVPFIIKAVSWGEDVDARLEILPKEIKEEIQQFMKQKAPEFIENALRNLKAFFKTFNKQHYNKLNSFTFFLNYLSDKSQLEQFFQNITSTTDDGENTRSIWAELLTNECQDHKTDEIAKMDKFMKCLSEKLGSNAVKELVLHSDGEMRVIFYPALRGEEKMLETLLNYLSAKDRKKVQRQVDEFLDETFKIDEYNQYQYHQFNPFF
ncbi:uncharacterized protein LOC124204626 [Daphnia pulex]|uniref:uncharacterized protein LOC124204626 n=1 Tax=Daphnia pulex TaxID=6669 RepID=UPI001EDFD2C4|nr:uncharacterized protein LOC124204626 [Daphnia pulex]